MKTDYHFHHGDSPILISIPHVGTHIPSEIARNMTAAALKIPDVDWHVNLLVDFAKDLGASILTATTMRYVIDLNRASDNSPLYPKQESTGLCPIDTFDKQAIYLHGKKPDEAEIKTRVIQYWQPYHDKLALELKRIRTQHGIAILWDAHSIKSEVTRFFIGKLPDLNIGTADSTSCAASLQHGIESFLQQSILAQNYSHVCNGRFKGGYITRHYGQPADNIHAIQLEISQCCYMQETAPYTYKPHLAKDLKFLLRELIQSSMLWANKC